MDKATAVAVFMYDGSEKYSTMTLNAIKTLLSSTPNVNAGVLVPPDLRADSRAALQRELSEWRTRLDIRSFKPHFADWNPTQHKLDIAQYADAYEYVLWVDSDTVTFADLNALISEFARSNAIVALVEDLITAKPQFRQRWSAATGSTNPRPFVPQTALMAFKRAAFGRLFPTWEATWKKWIEPAPFAFYGDPDPAFQGSAFCIEQYALGLALEQLNMLADGSLFVIPRRQIIFKDVGADGPTGPGGAFRLPFAALFAAAPGLSGGGSLQAGSFQLGSFQPGSFQLGSYQLGSYQAGAGSYAFGAGASSYAAGSYQLGSGQLAGSLGSYQLGSYQVGSAQFSVGSAQLAVGSAQLGSFQLGSYQLGSYQLGSSQLGSYQLGSHQLGSYQTGAGSYPVGSYALGSYAFAESLKLNEALESAGLIGVVNVNSGLHYDIVVDSFAGSLLHFYSFNYEPGYSIYKGNTAQINNTLKQIWSS